MRRASIPLLAAAGLALAAAPAQAAPTGRVLVLLHRADGARAQASAVHAFLARTGARRAGPQVPEIGLVTGAIFVVIVLLFRKGVWGTARDLLSRHPGKRTEAPERDPVSV